jgi:hypothetical protein
MRWVWLPLATLQEGLGGKTKTITMLVVAAASIVLAGLVVIPYPLKVESSGNALPKVRRWVYTSVPGEIIDFGISDKEAFITENRALVQMRDSALTTKIIELKGQIKAAELEAAELEDQARIETNPNERQAKIGRAELRKLEASHKAKELEELYNRARADKGSLGRFTINAPVMSPQEQAYVPADGKYWTVLNSNFREQMPPGRTVQPNEPMIRLGATRGLWELEMKIPQKHIGQVLRAFSRLEAAQTALLARIDEEMKQAKEEPKLEALREKRRAAAAKASLDVEYIMLGDATRKFKGKLYRDRIAGEATPDNEATSGQEPEPVVLAWVEIEGNGIDDYYQVRNYMDLVAGSGVRAKIVCGDHPAGYSLFYGVWEFMYEKVVFFFF